MGNNVTSHASRPKLTSKRFAKKIRIRAPQEKPSEAACLRPNVMEVTVAEPGALPNVRYGSRVDGALARTF